MSTPSPSSETLPQAQETPLSYAEALKTPPYNQREQTDELLNTTTSTKIPQAKTKRKSLSPMVDPLPPTRVQPTTPTSPHTRSTSQSPRAKRKVPQKDPFPPSPKQPKLLTALSFKDFPTKLHENPRQGALLHESGWATLNFVASRYDKPRVTIEEICSAQSRIDGYSDQTKALTKPFSIRTILGMAMNLFNAAVKEISQNEEFVFVHQLKRENRQFALIMVTRDLKYLAGLPSGTGNNRIQPMSIYQDARKNKMTYTNFMHTMFSEGSLYVIYDIK
eukprot:TRINITY_DN121_c1_g1_i1.p1 TRINITY_DN121_c1_g1~~TRINITY_DN121_c1_g1_i1.p1  ORF type:complete len:277 (+),score=28.85 TRINITY_DN121_c1_g1_i1:118-948(+)